MPDIKDSVGDGGINNIRDVALVQAMLTVVKGPKGAPYLTGYDGKSGHHTITAITAFQTDQGLLPKPGAAHAPAGPGGAAPAVAVTEKAGQVAKGSAMLAKLVAALPADFATMRVIENTRTVYFPGADADSKGQLKSYQPHSRPRVRLSNQSGSVGGPDVRHSPNCSTGNSFGGTSVVPATI
jgi:peptidoglycan hydrolase-like protein with peptidoglycan-binding domain